MRIWRVAMSDGGGGSGSSIARHTSGGVERAAKMACHAYLGGEGK